MFGYVRSKNSKSHLSRILATLAIIAISGCGTDQTSTDESTEAGSADFAAAGFTLAEKIASMEVGLRPARRLFRSETERWTIEERMARYGVPGVSIAIISDDELAWAKGYGVLSADGEAPVTPDTVFSVGSLSKVGAAMTALRLVADGTLDLDTNVNTYTTRWDVPDSPKANGEPVTLRRIFSHTAGLSVHGFADFLPGEPLPSLVEILDGAGPAKNRPVRIILEPGTKARYSGGGTTVAELVIEDATGEAFVQAAQQQVFTPLNMTRSTYKNPLPAEHGDIARAHNASGALTAKPRGWHTFAERAASGLWTTPSDYARMVIALADSYHGRSTFLPQSLAAEALTEVAPGSWGIGPNLTGVGVNRRFSHGGSNESYKAHMEVYLERGEGMIVFTNGSKGASLYEEIRLSAAEAFGWPGPKQKFVNNHQTPDRSPTIGRYAAREDGNRAVQSIEVSALSQRR